MAFDKAVDSAQLNAGLTAVANAIRTKSGTTSQLSFPSEFVSTVQAITSMPELKIAVTAVAGAAVTAAKGELSVSGTADSTGVCTLTVPEAGTWQITASKGTAHNTVSCVVGFTYRAEIPFTYTVKLVDPTTTNLDRHAVTLNGTAQKAGTTFSYVTGADTLQIKFTSGSEVYLQYQVVTLADESLGKLTKIHAEQVSYKTYETLYEFVPAKNVVITINSRNGGGYYDAEITAP